MDFLETVKKKLEEMEQQARLLQEMEQGAQPAVGRDPRPLFQPRSQPTQAQAGQPTQIQQAQGRQQAKTQLSKSQQFKGQQSQARQPVQPQRSLTSREEAFETPHCATEGGVPGLPGTPQLRPRLVDDLNGRLDEAFLLSEILGPPRCMRDWTEP